jgi:hypothetical protein
LQQVHVLNIFMGSPIDVEFLDVKSSIGVCNIYSKTYCCALDELCDVPDVRL